MIFLAGCNRYTQRTLLRDIHNRLTNQAGCEDVRYRPSRRRPWYVIADVDPTAFARAPSGPSGRGAHRRNIGESQEKYGKDLSQA
ncbi:hypothetical protein GRX01_03965 [Halobaculum sp. WSA2]|uniref:Uncharacterized protein n=1 Tax=Halobaculum saliterrae TaxID=2073113 RepID=A0A6B0SP51_9EURY|nr:hypothetical protein [Halobaculum saliterrae]